MVYKLPGYVVREIFHIEETCISLSAVRYALRTKTIIWIL